MSHKTMTPEQKLQALFVAQNPPVQDLGFEIAVLDRIAKQRAVMRFTHLAMMMVMGGGLLAAIMRAMETGRMASAVPVLASIAAAGVAALVIWTMERARALKP